MSPNLTSSISKYLIIFLIIFLTINILPIDFYVDIEKMMKTKTINFEEFKYLPHYFFIKSITNLDHERYTLVFHNIFVFINFIFLSIPIFLHSFFYKKSIVCPQKLNRIYQLRLMTLYRGGIGLIL